MKRHASLWLVLGLSLGLGACGVGQRQNPVSTDGELGTTQAVAVEEDKPTAYTTRAGDTLADVAGRPEIYGDPALWPLLSGENSELVAGKGAHETLEGGLVLQVPRGVSPEAMEQARETARQAQAAAKQAGLRRGPRAHAKPKLLAVKPASAPKPVKSAKSVPTSKPAAKPQASKPAVTAAPAPVVQATAAPTPAPVPPAKHHGGGLRPLLLLLLLVLLALGAVLWAFSRRDSNDGV